MTWHLANTTSPACSSRSTIPHWPTSSIHDYTYKSDHVDVFRHRRVWFERNLEAHLVMWWIQEGHVPTIEEANERLRALRAKGPTPEAFTLRHRFDPPD